MTTTDTVVGIVGAVVLAAAMIGVFVYEYNNVPDPAVDPKSEAGQRAAFLAAHPTLNATGDLDGDGKRNDQDDDLDGDGVPNARDNGTAVSRTFDGSVPQQPAPGATASSAPFTLQAEAGVSRIVLTLTYPVSAPQPNPLLPRTPNLALHVTTPAGDDATCATQSVSGSTATCVVEVPAPEPGTYTGTVTAQGPTPGGSFSVVAAVEY